jgi:hypothetical protein
MINIDKIIGIYCIIDDFNKELFKTVSGHMVKKDNDKRTRNRQCKLTDSEVITILLIFHLGQFRKPETFLSILCESSFEK